MVVAKRKASPTQSIKKPSGVVLWRLKGVVVMHHHPRPQCAVTHQISVDMYQIYDYTSILLENLAIIMLWWGSKASFFGGRPFWWDVALGELLHALTSYSTLAN